jgi:BON domain
MKRAVAPGNEQAVKLRNPVLAGAIALAFAIVAARPALVRAQASGAEGVAATKAAEKAPAGVAAAGTTHGISEETLPPTAHSPMAGPPASGAPAAVAPANSVPSTISPTLIEAPTKAASPAPREHRRRRRAPRKAPEWVIRSKVQLALKADPRFNNVDASITQPGVVVLEGDVFDNEVKAAATRTVAGIQGVKQVINALKTETLRWLLEQNRVNQMLQRSGFAFVSVKVIGTTAFISGKVSSEADKDRAVAVVKSAAPDLTIGTNLIDVVSAGL